MGSPRTDQASRHILAPKEFIYAALTSAEAVKSWLPPKGARAAIHAFDPRPGGAFRLTLEFADTGSSGTRKTTKTSDVVDGAFVDLIPGARVQQKFDFVSDDPEFAGTMVMTWDLADVADGTLVTVTAWNVPAGISREDHERGMASSLANLAAFVEAARNASPSR